MHRKDQLLKLAKLAKKASGTIAPGMSAMANVAVGAQSGLNGLGRVAANTAPVGPPTIKNMVQPQQQAPLQVAEAGSVNPASANPRQLGLPKVSMDKEALNPKTILALLKARQLQKGVSPALASKGLDAGQALAQTADKALRRFDARNLQTPGLASNTGGQNMLAEIAKSKYLSGLKPSGPATGINPVNVARGLKDTSVSSQTAARGDAMYNAIKNRRLGQNADPIMNQPQFLQHIKALQRQQDDEQVLKWLAETANKSPSRALAKIPSSGPTGLSVPGPRGLIPTTQPSRGLIPTNPQSRALAPIPSQSTAMTRANPQPRAIQSVEHLSADSPEAIAVQKMIESRGGRVPPRIAQTQRIPGALPGPGGGQPGAPVQPPMPVINPAAPVPQSSSNGYLGGLAAMGLGGVAGQVAEPYTPGPSPAPALNLNDLRPEGHNLFR